jgi:flagellar hook-associated protein 1 FlgK
MYGINVGFEIARRALLTQQVALNITGHNIANVNTPGYTRQNPILEATSPLPVFPSFGGSGVEVSEIRRQRSYFLDTQVRKQSRLLGEWENLKQTWSQIEMIINEPSDSGLSQMMSDFWDAWSDLGNNPESLAAKEVVKEKSQVLISSFHRIDQQLTDLRDSLDLDVTQTVGAINEYLTSIASVNEQIATLEIGSGKANDLRDQRDYLIEELAKIVDVTTRELDDGSVNVYIGAYNVVDQNEYFPLKTEISYNPDGSRQTSVLRFDSAAQLKVSSGQLKAIMTARDEIIPDLIENLDTLASQMVQSINSVHSAGYTNTGQTGINFFDEDGLTAGTIGLSYEISIDANNIAVSSDPDAINAANVQAILDLRHQDLMSDNTASFDEFYTSFVGTVGTRANEAYDMTENYQLVLNEVEYHRQSLHGVSLDEEMTKMISYQHAYAAAAKLMDVMDSAMDSLMKIVE